MNTYPPAPSSPVSGSSMSCLSRWRRLLVAVVAAVLTLGGGLAVVTAGTSVASAQPDGPTELDPDDCDGEDWIPTPEEVGAPAVNRLRQECKIIIEAYNSWVTNSRSVFTQDPDGNEHKLASWGDGYIGDWDGVTIRESDKALVGLEVTPPGDNSRAGIAGEIPGSLCNLGRLKDASFNNNRLSGTIPECFARLSSLLTFTAASNDLSGSIPAEFAESGPNRNLKVLNLLQNKLNGTLPSGFDNLVWLDVKGNFLSGNLPEINASGKMLFFDVSGNELGGSIPSTYPERFTRIVYFSLSNNSLTGAFDPSWINDISFVNFLNIRPSFRAGTNRLCFSTAADIDPRPLVEPRDDEILDGSDGRALWGGLFSNTNGRHGEIIIFLAGNVCREDDSSSYSQMALPPVGNVRKSISGGVLTVEWNPPTDPQTDRVYAASEYSIQIREAKRANFNSDELLKVKLNTDSADLDTGYLDRTSGTTVQYDLGGGDNSILRAGQTVAEGELVVSIWPVYSIRQPQGDVSTSFYGPGGGGQSGGWRAFNVRQDNTSAQELARNLGLRLNQEMYSWDAATQTWSTHPTEGDAATTLDMGTAVMFNDGVTDADNLRFAGLSRADQNMVVTLSQGWNIMAPPRANMEVGADNPEALFDGVLTDCDNLAGVLAVITYDSRIGDFKILLPCHPDVQTEGYDPLDVIDVHDTMYVFFQSQLSVPVTWDDGSGDNGNYVPA